MWTDGRYIYVLRVLSGEIFARRIDPLDGFIAFVQSIGCLPSSNAYAGQHNIATDLAFRAPSIVFMIMLGNSLIVNVFIKVLLSSCKSF